MSRPYNPHITPTIVATALIAITTWLAACTTSHEPSADDFVAALKQSADLVTTEVKVRKIAYYDSGSSDHITLTDPTTWRIGERRCIVPVDIWIRYGYDLRHIELSAVRIDQERKTVEVRLPHIKLIDSGYDPDINPDEVVSIATGLRDAVGHETIEQIRRETYEETIKQDISTDIEADIQNNAQWVISGIARSLGFDGAEIVEY